MVDRRGADRVKRSPMPARTEPLRRVKHLSPRSKRREAEQAERSIVRQRVFARDRWQCQVAATAQWSGYDAGPCFGRLEMHERRKASQGGRYDEANGATTCSHHNAQLEADADLARWARSVGLVLRRGDQ